MQGVAQWNCYFIIAFGIGDARTYLCVPRLLSCHRDIWQNAPLVSVTVPVSLVVPWAKDKEMALKAR